MKQYPHHIDILKSVLSLKAFFFKKNIYLAALGLGFGTRDLWSLMQHMGSLVAARGSSSPDQGRRH